MSNKTKKILRSKSIDCDELEKGGRNGKLTLGEKIHEFEVDLKKRGNFTTRVTSGIFTDPTEQMEEIKQEEFEESLVK